MSKPAEYDILKQTFKKLKKKDADLRGVINTACKACCRENLQRVTNIQHAASDKYMTATADWAVHMHDAYPGLYVISHVFSDPGLRELLLCTLLNYPTGRATVGLQGEIPQQAVRTNLSCLDVECEAGCTYWSSKEGNHRLVDKLRWISLGYHYDWTLREYRAGFCSTLPPELQHIAHAIVTRLKICDDLRADAAIVNYYHSGDTLSFHQDELEWDLTKPLVSVSLGLPGILCVGGTTRDTPPVSILINTGDVVILSGHSRTAYHAVPRVFKSCCVHNCQHLSQTHQSVSQSVSHHPDNNHSGIDPGTCVQDHRRTEVLGGLETCEELLNLCDNTLSSEEFYNTVCEFLDRTRINISIRQVQKHA